MPFHSVTSPRVATSKPFGTYTMKIIMFFSWVFRIFPFRAFCCRQFPVFTHLKCQFFVQGLESTGRSMFINHSPLCSQVFSLRSCYGNHKQCALWQWSSRYLWTPEQHGLLMRDQAWQLAYHRNPDTIWKNAVRDSSETPTSFDCSGGPAKHNLALQATHHGEDCCSQDTEEAWKSCVGSACQFGTVPNPDQNIGSKCTTLKLGSNGAGPKPKERPRRSHVRILGKRMINIHTLQCHQTWQLFKCPKLNMTNRGVFVGTSMLDKLQKFFFPKSEPLLVQIATWQVMDHCHLLDRWCQINVII